MVVCGSVDIFNRAGQINMLLSPQLIHSLSPTIILSCINSFYYLFPCCKSLLLTGFYLVKVPGERV